MRVPARHQRLQMMRLVGGVALLTSVLAAVALAPVPAAAVALAPVALAPASAAPVSALALSVRSARLPSQGGRPTTWTWPVQLPVRVLRVFDPPAHVWLAGHRGVDLAAAAGQPIRAAASGVVSFAGPLAGRGVVVVVHGRTNRGTLRTTYEPVRALVVVGDSVTTGQIIGTLEPTDGHCALDCLHWGLRLGLEYLDPLSLIGRPRIRLLPHLNATSASTSTPSTTDNPRPSLTGASAQAHAPTSPTLSRASARASPASTALRAIGGSAVVVGGALLLLRPEGLRSLLPTRRRRSPR